MTIDELKGKIETVRQRLKRGTPAISVATENGPIGIDVIDALVATIEAQQSQIDALSARLNAPPLNKAFMGPGAK